MDPITHQDSDVPEPLQASESPDQQGQNVPSYVCGRDLDDEDDQTSQFAD